MSFKETIRIKGDTKDVNRKLDQTNKKLKTMDARIKGVAKAGLTFAAAYLGARGIINVVKSSVTAFIEQEKAVRMLDQALGRNSKSLQIYAAELQKVTQFGDEETIQAIALIAAFEKEEEALKKAIKATMDLAAAKGFDLRTAADLVGKTLGSTTNALTRYGIEVKGAVGSTQRLESLVGNIDKVFGGMAEAMAETTEGSIKQMTNATGDLSEVLGEALSPAIRAMTEDIKEAAEFWSDFFALLSGPDVELKGILPEDQETAKRLGAIQTALEDIKDGTKLASEVVKELGLEMESVWTAESVIIKLQAEEALAFAKLQEAQHKFREQQKKDIQEQAKETALLRKEAQEMTSELEEFEDVGFDFGDVDIEEIAEFTQDQIDRRNILRDTEEEIAGFLADSATSMIDAAASGEDVLDILVDSAKQLLLMIARAKIYAAIMKATGAGFGAATGGVGSIAKAILGFHQGGIVKMHSGGLVGDEVLGILKETEFVFKPQAVRQIGIPTLNHMNQTGQVPLNFSRMENQLALLNKNVSRLDRQVNIRSDIDGVDFVKETVEPSSRRINNRSW